MCLNGVYDMGALYNLSSLGFLVGRLPELWPPQGAKCGRSPAKRARAGRPPGRWRDVECGMLKLLTSQAGAIHA